MKSRGILAALFVITVTASALPTEQVDFHGYKVMRIVPSNVDQLKSLQRLQRRSHELDFWSQPRSIEVPVDVMVSPEKFPDVAALLDASNMSHSVLMDDVNTFMQQENPAESPALDTRENPVFSFTRYHRLNVIHDYLEQLVRSHPDIASTEVIGKSTENRDLKIIKIGKPNGQRKPVIWIDAGIHAREWIATATATYFINQLVENYADNKELVDNIDWYILPSANPDGYEYTHTNNRMWRKTRSSNTLRCKGADPNRNFGFHWMEGGASSDPCSDIYAGPRAFSEPETQAMADFITKYRNDIKVYLTFHAYGQMWLTPWGYTSALPADYNNLVSVAKKATSALQVLYGTRYIIGSSTNVLYVAAGGSDDWAKGEAGINYSYCVELRDKGNRGFLLPASQIQPTGRETWEAVKVVAQEVVLNKKH